MAERVEINGVTLRVARAGCLPGAATAVIDGGHLLSVQVPEALASMMRRFYDGLRP